jgi:hypothetical protein
VDPGWIGRYLPFSPPVRIIQQLALLTPPDDDHLTSTTANFRSHFPQIHFQTAEDPAQIFLTGHESGESGYQTGEITVVGRFHVLRSRIERDRGEPHLT